MKLSPQETRLIQLVQDDFPLVPRPYAWVRGTNGAFGNDGLRTDPGTC